MRGESQEAFMARVRKALANRGEPVALPDDLEVARLVTPDRDVLAVFAEHVDQAGMHAHRVADEQALVNKVIELAAELGARTVLVPDEPIPARKEIIAALEKRGIRPENPDDPDAAFDADLGLTGVTSAIAETASISVTSGGSHRRLASLAVPNHIAIVRADQVRADLLDWVADLPAEPPASEVLISGPSKTADIEMTLVTGVHGPKEVHVIVIG